MRQLNMCEMPAPIKFHQYSFACRQIRVIAIISQCLFRFNW